jgi:hypothetical protein
MYRYQLVSAKRRKITIRRIPIFDLNRCTYQQSTTKDFIEQLGQQHYLHIDDAHCSSCHQNMELEHHKRRLDGRLLRCRPCDQRRSIRHGTFFAMHNKIPLPTFFHIIRSLYEGRLQRFIAAETQLSCTTIERIHHDYTELCQKYNDDHPIIFDRNDIVEIDEKKLRWHLGLYDHDPNAMVVEGEWVLGLFGRNSKKVYMLPVIGRGYDDLIPIIERRIEKGATVISDKLPTYNILNAKGYTYRYINKKKDGFARDDAALDLKIHVNSIEGQWQKIENELIHHHSLYGNRIASLLHEYLFKVNGGVFLDLLKYQ